MVKVSLLVGDLGHLNCLGLGLSAKIPWFQSTYVWYVFNDPIQMIRSHGEGLPPVRKTMDFPWNKPSSGPLRVSHDYGNPYIYIYMLVYKPSWTPLTIVISTIIKWLNVKSSIFSMIKWLNQPYFLGQKSPRNGRWCPGGFRLHG